MKYTAITLGPIGKTLGKAKSTKAFWAASYLFSYLMKNIIREIGAPASTYITPCFNEKDLLNDHFPKVGLFHDRFIIKENEAGNVEEIVQKVLKAFAYKMAEDLNCNKPTDKKVDPIKIHNYCKAYFNLRVLSGIELTPKQLDGSSVMHQIDHLLDVAELNNRTNPYDNETYLTEFLEKVPKKGESGSAYNFLHSKAFQQKEFPSTAEIATTELRGNEIYKSALEILKGSETNGQIAFYEYLQNELKGKYRKYLKHFAIVEADGDNFGSFIKVLAEKDKANNLIGEDSLIARFSKNAFEFSRAASGLINQGVPEEKEARPKIKGYAVYAGGDDLLFFAPVVSTVYDKADKLIAQKNIFDLIDAIDALFDKFFIEDDVFKPIFEETEGLKPVSMSYGISVCYYKFPLSESKATSSNALHEVAKKTPQENPVKNRIVFSFRGHSGDTYGFNLVKGKNSEVYQCFKDLYKTSIEDGVYLNRVMQILAPLEAVFYGVGNLEYNEELSESDRATVRENKWDAFFKEYFNESIHTQGVGEDKVLIPFLQKLKALFKSVYAANTIEGTAFEFEGEELSPNQQNWQLIYGMLKFISFIHNQEK